jgi:hypothetical protein
MHEIILNTHIHSTYSDGTGDYRAIIEAAHQSGLDVVIITDHNLWVGDVEGYYGNEAHKVLFLVGEEIHNQALQPQKNHLLIFGAESELCTLAADTQRLINRVNQINGLSFIAHPFDPDASIVGEGPITWDNWDVRGFTGIELWNTMSEFKSLIKSNLHALFYAIFPELIARGPQVETLQKWDELLLAGQRIVALGGSDAHALRRSLGPIHKTLFPYDFHFRCVNNHLLLPQPLSGDFDQDKALVLNALRKGSFYVGYDLPHSTSGFHFTAQGKDAVANMGEEITNAGGVTFQIRLPDSGECRLIRNGQVVKVWKIRNPCTYITTQPGIYRVEVYRNYMGMQRGWIFSNPIYVKKSEPVHYTPG